MREFKLCKIKGTVATFRFRNCFATNSFSLLGLVGQRHVPDSGSQEPDERRGVHCQGLLRRLYKVPKEQKHGGTQHARGLLENESSREEAAGEAREAGRRGDQQSQEIFAEEACQPCAGSERVQSHG